MESKFGLICLISLLITASQGKRWNTNKDSIVVDAHYSAEDEGIRSDPVAEKPECYTSDGEPGECVTVLRCHPILFSEKGQVRNSGLAITYAKTEDVCSTKNSVEGSYERKDSIEETQIGQKVICCSKDRIQYDSRSELNQDLETYTTTSSYSVFNVELDVTGFPIGNGEALPQTTLSPTIDVEDEVIVVDAANKPSSSPPVVIDVEVELGTETTTQKIQVQEQDIIEPSPEPEPETEAEETPQVVVTQSPIPVEDMTQQQGQQSEVAIEDIFEQHPPTSACPTLESYGTWPVFYDYPWLATIQSRAKTGPVCSASLITESHVLTAAHCISRFNSRDVARMQIRIGFSKRSNNDTFNDYYVLRNASKIIFHKRFHEQSKMDNNIALIKLDEPVEFDDHIAPIGVFNGMKGFDIGNCSAAEAGWIKFGNRKVTGASGGVIHFKEAPMSDFHLRESIDQVLSNDECNVQLNSQINEKMICAKPRAFEEPSVSTDFFRWNDGVPLVVKVGNVIQQIGIKSWGYEGQQYPTVFTRVDSYLDWIRNNLRM